MSYAPHESAADLLLERSNFIGGFLGNMAYGVHGTLYCVCAYLLVRRRRKVDMSMFWLAYITLLFAVATIYVACGIKLSEMLWIDDRDFPGGPVAYQNALFSNYVQLLLSTSYNVMTFMADGLLVYRCYLMWSNSRLRWVAALPFLLFLASTGKSPLPPNPPPLTAHRSDTAANYGILFWSLSSALNVLASLLIVARIHAYRSELQGALGAEHARPYTSASAMFLESAATYAIASIIFIGTYATNNWFQNIVVPVLGQITCIAPLLIILRVAYGRAYTFRTVSTSTRIEWGSAPPASSQSEAASARAFPAAGRRSAKEKEVAFETPSTVSEYRL
ncbi:hypothetical protein GLOTRDRAFT_129343 [Gloeophyllum trabeum ATCC 11539]|uniref:Uncharacterized protein n=1 Tax=Gloeophyllum trabeum (strain ATCC 11539 / FP-39264 / Madison 617) TaxID=670483 RepID=S7Q6J6_GLOTA|nr:uncharacterized protein GLOTRDRAFT_129343 [Gloeophyllum trabeum ATCC 11539]EPQ55043.1 hypothetical protein GLOTRDRAFT_129343 [Gloeophyllum trabeum ATCC 11539]